MMDSNAILHDEMSQTSAISIQKSIGYISINNEFAGNVQVPAAKKSECRAENRLSKETSAQMPRIARMPSVDRPA